MTALDVLHEVTRKGGRLLPNGNKITMEAPAPLPNELINRIRNNKQALQVAGTDIPQNSKVMVLYGSANRDERHFDNPDNLIAERDPQDQLAFGWGPHRCLGAHVARLEALVVARYFQQRVASVRSEGTAKRTHNPLLRGMAHLPVSIEAK